MIFDWKKIFFVKSHRQIKYIFHLYTYGFLTNDGIPSKHHTHWCHFWVNPTLSLYWFCIMISNSLRFFLLVCYFAACLVFPYIFRRWLSTCCCCTNRWQNHTKLFVNSQCFKAGHKMKVPNFHFWHRITKSEALWQRIFE